MSIVERALRKLHTERRAEVASNARLEGLPAIGKVIERPEPAIQHPTARVHTPARIVHVDRDALRSVGLLPAESEEHELSDQYRVIKRPLIRRAFEGVEAGAPSPQLIMLTSALPGDGKTFTSINLALSMALETDHTVLLVDTDVAKPHVSRLFGLENEPGLLDVLSNPTLMVESLVLGTDVPRLSLLPAGRRSETATELLASRRHQEIAQRLAQLNPRGIVLFDSSPVLLTSEARVLATLVGQVVVVVKAGETPQQAVHDTIEVLGPSKRISLVLNQAKTSGALGYYYGHRYGYKHSASHHSDTSS